MKTRKASTAVEFALILPALAAIFGAVVDLGWFMWIQNLAEQAAREGARAGSRVTKALDESGPADADDIESTSTAQADFVLDLTWEICQTYGCAVTSSWANDAVTGLDMLTVDVTVAVKPLVGFIPTTVNGVAGSFTVVTLRQT